MNSTEKNKDADMERNLLEAFVSDLVSSGVISDAHQAFPAMAPDKNAGSYFEEHRPLMGKAACCSINYNCAEDLQRILEIYWRDQPYMKSIAPSIAELSFALKSKIQLDDDISPFVYTL